MTAVQIIAEVFYCIIGLIFILCGTSALRDRGMKARIPTALFWYLLAFTFMAGPYFPKWVTGLCILVIAGLTALKKVLSSRLDVPKPDQTRKHADSLGYKVFIPAVVLALAAVLVATFTKVGANNAIGVASAIALVAVLIVTRAPAKYVARDGDRLMQNIGPVGILPQVLAALGALFTAAGVGEVISSGIATVIPQGNRFLGVVAYCVGMAVFTVIMGNGFAAFSVITVGVGIPFVIMQGANPIVVGALGLTAGYCGTLVTPMAANFNIMPAALLETKNKYAIIKAQVPFAIVMLVIHIFLMYFWAF